MTAPPPSPPDHAPLIEDATPALAFLTRLEGRLRSHLDGSWDEVEPLGWLETRNPATGALLGHVAETSPNSLEGAVRGARAAQPAWAALGGAGRAAALEALAWAVRRHAPVLALLETLDNGKPIREASTIDVPATIRHLEHHARRARLLEVELPGREPLGVVGHVVASNFPLLLAAWHIAPALAAGNTVVLKPSEHTSATALFLAELATTEAGIPAGVLNVVTGGAEAGAALCSHPELDMVAFTGSTAVGKQVASRLAGRGLPLLLELGGKSPVVVFGDADLDAAADGVVASIWFNQGEVCCAGSRLLAHESVLAPLLDRVRDRMDELRVGDPLDRLTDLGALVSRAHRDRLAGLVDAAVRAGAGCHRPARPLPDEGAFYPPTLLTGVPPDAALVRDELQGPVLVSASFRTTDEAIALANDTRYGLAASVWTDRGSLALEVARRIRAGVVWINGANALDPACAFGGSGDSGFGRHGGVEGMRAYTRSPVTRQRSIAVPPNAPALPGPARAGAPASAPTPSVGDAITRALEAAAWATRSGHRRAAQLEGIARALEGRRERIGRALAALHLPDAAGAQELDRALARLRLYAAWADAFGGHLPIPPFRGCVLALPEPVGIVGVVAPPEHPLLALVTLVAAPLAVGCRVVAVPHEDATELVGELRAALAEAALPPGVLSLVEGPRDQLGIELAAHRSVATLWYAGPREAWAELETRASTHLQPVWMLARGSVAWTASDAPESAEWLRRATATKTVWLPQGA